jgi:hypothetical protein
VSLFGGVLLAVLAVIGIVGRGTVSGTARPKMTLASSTCATSGFCVSSPTPGPELYPGVSSASNLPLTFTNSMSVPIHVYRLTTTFTNTFPSGCPSAGFELNQIHASGSTPAVTIDFPTATSWITVPGASGSTPGSATYPASLSMADSGNQDPCQRLGLTMSYQAVAYYTVPTATTLTSSPNPSTYAQPVTLTATVSPNITPASAGATPVGSVTFYKCTTDSCATPTSLGSSALNSSGVATLPTSFTPVGSYKIYAKYTPADSTNFSSSTSSQITQVVNYTYCITSKTSINVTVASGQDVCVTSTGSVNGGITVNGGGRLDVLGGTVTGNIAVQSGGALSFQGGVLGGSLTGTGATLFSVCGAKLQSNVSLSSSTAFALIGDAGDDGSPACAGNTVGGSVTLSNNTAGAEVGGNTITGGLSLTGTTGAGQGPENANPEIEANKISGGLSCSGNTPPPINDGQPNAVSGKRSGQCSVGGF